MEDRIKEIEAYIKRLEEENAYLRSLQQETIDYSNMEEHDYIGANITALGKNVKTVRRRTSILPRAVGEANGLAEAVIIRNMPFTKNLLDILYMASDWTSAEDGKALSEMNATISRRYFKRYPSERVYAREVEEEEGGGL